MDENLIATICMVCTYMRTSYSSKKHGGYNIYEDEKIKMGLDTYVSNISVHVETGGKNVMVLLHSYAGYNQVYHPGEWENYILSLRPAAELCSRADKEELERKKQEEHDSKFAPAGEELDNIFK